MWDITFLQLFDRCLKLHASGRRDYESFFEKEDIAFLDSIGYQPREFYDFVEDLNNEQEPAASTALLIAAVRRDYFRIKQASQRSSHVILRDELPTFGDTLEGIAYLPRIISKARGKLRGELDPDIMYGCGGDRHFLAQHGNIHPADFLRHVWAAGDDDRKIANFVTEAKASSHDHGLIP
ncbi:MAG: hypothetical protein RLZZ553_1266 [Verrucomicrobiota bacterium]|jgi:hypothetical protein